MPDTLTPELTPEQARETLAAELALGLLDGAERAEAMRLSLADPAFAALVDAWAARFAPMHETFGESLPAPELWSAIERRLPDVPAVAAPLAANDNARFWRWGTFGSTAVAAALAAVLVLRPVPIAPPVEIVRAPDQMSVAQLGAAEGGALLAASYDPAQAEMRIRAITLPDSRLSPELWVIPADGVPRSLGLVAATGTSRVVVPVALRAMMADGATLAITLEPTDGAPHAAPSSTPIAVGKIATI